MDVAVGNSGTSGTSDDVEKQSEGRPGVCLTKPKPPDAEATGTGSVALSIQGVTSLVKVEEGNVMASKRASLVSEI